MSCFMPPLILEGPRLQDPDATLGVVSHQLPLVTEGSLVLLLKDLRYQLDRKRSLKQIVRHYTLEELITAMLSECQNDTPPKRVSLFARLSKVPKRSLIHHRRGISNEE